MARGHQIDRSATVRLLTVLATLYLIFVFYGSWVPLHFVPQPFTDALKFFSALPFSDQSIESATDWATNFILLIPLAFLWGQRFLPPRQGVSRLAFRLLIIVLGIALAFFLEFSQLYFPPRTVSQKDILALSLGVFFGVFAQQKWGDGVERWLNQLWQNERGQTRLIQLLHVYLLVFFVFSVWPLDLTISIVELYHKWNEGRVVFVPFAGLKGGTFDNIYETATDLLVWVPVGLFLALDRKVSIVRIAGIAWLAAAIIEAAQLFVYSRVTDITDVLLAGFGAVIGALMAKRESKAVKSFSKLSTVQWFSIWVGWVLIVFCAFWYPFDFQIDGVNFENAWIALTRIPFLMLFEGSTLNAINEMLRKIAFFIPGGAIWGFGMATSKNYGRNNKYKIIGFFAFASVALLVEAGQLFIPGKFADFTDVLLETGGALIGMMISTWVLSAYRGGNKFEKYGYHSRDNSHVCMKIDSSPEIQPAVSTDQLPHTNKNISLDFLPFVVALFGLSILIGRGSLLTLPTLWFVASILGILASALSSRRPVVPIISYLVLAYGLPRYTNEYVFIIKAGVFNWICLIGFVGWIVDSVRRNYWPQWRQPVSLVFFAFLFVLALSWVAASWSNAYQDIYPRHSTQLFLHALVLFLIASTLAIRRNSLVIWGLILCILPGLRWFLQSSEGIYLDNDISSFSTLLLPIALVGGWYVQRIWIRTIFFASAISMLGIIGLAQNRASAISLVLGVLYLVWCEFNRQRLKKASGCREQFINRVSGQSFLRVSTLKKLVFATIAFLTLIFFSTLLPLKEYQARFSVLWNPNAIHETAVLDRETINERYELWSGGIDMALDHPILGVGPGNYANLIGIYQLGKSKLPAHNSFISVAAESGFIGLALFVTLLFLSFRMLGRLSSQSSMTYQGVGVALQSSMIAFIAVSMFMSRHDLVFLYVLFGLAVALSIASKEDRIGSEGRFQKAFDIARPHVPESCVRVFPGTGSAASEIASSSKAGHLGGLDGLRAIAALSVFGVHFNQMVELKTSIGPFDLARWLANGNTGVALFFVLSGFLLSLPFWRQGRAWGSRIDVKSYIFHRLIRVLPAYYLCLFGLLAIMLAKGRVPDLNNLLSHVVFLYNINDRNILSLNAPFWSLALEMQFYLLLPLLMLALTRLSAWAALGLLAVLSVGAYCANYGLISYLLERDQWPILMTLIWPFSLYISGPDSFVLTYSLLAHLTYFLIGIATALIFVMGEGADQLLTMRMKMSAADWLFWSCATAIFLILSTPLDDLLQAPHGHYNWPFVPFLLAVMIFVTPQARLAKVFLESRPLRWLGLISYGFYIFHYPILTFLARMFGQYGLSMTDFWWLFAILSLLASMAVAAASYWMFELPLMRWAQKVPIWQPGGRSVRAHSVERASVSLSPNKDVLAQQPTGNDWIRVKIHFRSSQLDVLKRLSDKLGVSLSAAARQVLEICIVDSGQYWASSKMTSENNQKVADAAGETYCVNMHYGQYEFLLEAADRIGRSIDEVFCLMIDHNSKTLLFSEQIGSTYDL